MKKYKLTKLGIELKDTVRLLHKDNIYPLNQLTDKQCEALGASAYFELAGKKDAS